MAPLTEAVLGLRPGRGDVQRPGRADARLTGLDELGKADVDDTLPARLASADPQQAVDLLAEPLAGWPGELVPEALLLLAALAAG